MNVDTEDKCAEARNIGAVIACSMWYVLVNIDI